MRSRLLLLTILTALLLVAAAITPGGGKAAEMPPQLVIGYQMIPNAEIIAKQMGWQEKTLGIPIRWRQFHSGMHVVRAMARGEVDIGLAGSSPTAAAICEGISLEAIWIHDVIADNEALVVRAEKNINTVQDLVGKRVAAPFGSTTHYHLMVALMLNNIDPLSLAYIALEPEEMLAAWREDKIDAGFVWEPTLSKMVRAGGKILLTSRQLVKRGFPTADICVVRQDFAARYPDLVVRYLKNLDRAVKLYRTEPEIAAAAVAKEFNISTTAALEQMRRLILLRGEEQLSGRHLGDIQWEFLLYSMFKDTAEFLVHSGVVAKAPPRDAFLRAVNGSYLQLAVELRE